MTKTKSKKTGEFFSGTTINKMVSLGRRIYYLGMDAGIVSKNPFARRGVLKRNLQVNMFQMRSFGKFMATCLII